MALLRISAKNLGSLALHGMCDRCAWLQLHVAFKTPFQIFPGIFSSIDSYTKKVVDNHFNKSGAPPSWFSEIGELTASLPPPHYSKFNTYIPNYDIQLTGAMDALFQMRDGSLCLADYKTSKFTEKQDTLLPMYKVQLNAYAFIAEKTKLGLVSSLALIYFEPETDPEHAENPSNVRTDGFALGFSTHIFPIELRPDEWVIPYLQKARALFNQAALPAGRSDCKDCPKLDSLISLIKH